jgi:hypothetical protein
MPTVFSPKAAVLSTKAALLSTGEAAVQIQKHCVQPASLTSSLLPSQSLSSSQLEAISSLYIYKPLQLELTPGCHPKLELTPGELTPWTNPHMS